MKRKITLFLPLLWAFSLLLCASPPAPARVLLKPNGSNAMPLRLKGLDADVAIEGQFATTKTVMTFQNEISEQIEADFIYTVPPRSVVTYFAYWYRDEKVVARVVEKERAAAIYQHITSRMRDPALIELIGKNTFRARIFPIEPDADLRVEIHTVETLRSTAAGAEYVFPLKPEVKGKGTLEKLNVRVRVKRDAGLLGAGTNYSLPVQSGDGVWKMHLSQRNFRPAQDLRVGLRFRPQALRARMISAHSGSNDGFFALSLTVPRAVSGAKLQISGVKTYEVLPARLPRLKAGEQVTVVGRYRGAGTAQVMLKGAGPGATVQFGGTRQQNGPATKFWASRQIEALSGNPKNRKRVVALSQRFTLPSKWTSWLAIPVEERERYHAEKAEVDLEYYGNLLVREAQAGRGAGAAARRYRAEHRRAARILGRDSQVELAELTEQALQEQANSVVWMSRAEGRERQRLLNQMKQLSGLSGRPVRRYLTEAEGRKKEGDLEIIASLLSKEIQAGRSGGGMARRLHNSLLAIDKKRQSRWGRNYLEENLKSDIQSTADAYVRMEKSGKPDPALLKRLANKLDTLVRYTDSKRDSAVREARGRYNSSKLNEINLQLAEEVIEGRDQGEVARKLERKHQELLAEGDYDWRHDHYSRRAYAARAHVQAQIIVREESTAAPDKQKLAVLNKELDRLAKAADRPSEAFLEWQRGWMGESLANKTLDQVRAEYGRDYYLRTGDPLISVEAPADAQQVIALLPGGEVKQLVYDAAARRWEARFDVPTYAAEGDYIIEVVIVDAAGRRRSFALTYQVDMSAPRGEALAQRGADGNRYRLEVRTSGDVARVSALLPSGDRVDLQPSATDKTRFLGHAPAMPAASGIVTYILTDRAHNRTQIAVDLSK